MQRLFDRITNLAEIALFSFVLPSLGPARVRAACDYAEERGPLNASTPEWQRAKGPEHELDNPYLAPEIRLQVLEKYVRAMKVEYDAACAPPAPAPEKAS